MRLGAASRRDLANCVFCGGAPTNREHIWPRWSHRFLPRGKKNWVALRATEYEDRSTYEVKTYSGDPHDWQVKCVDAKCNNGWMRAQEDRFRPLFIRMLSATEECPIRLGEQEQKVIAAWFAIKAIVQESAPHEDRISHHMHRRLLRTRRTPPERSWRMWVGKYQGEQPASLWVSLPFQLHMQTRRRKDNQVTYYNSQIASYVLGQLFIVLVRSPHELFVRSWRFRSNVGTLCQIWPPTGFSILWPLKPLTNVQAANATMGIRAFLANSARRSINESRGENRSS